VATIDPNQQYDIIHTLTFSEASGTCRIRLYRGSSSATSGTVYYRAGTSGDWTSLSVSGTATTFPVTSTTMQVAHDWNKSGNDYMTPSFYSAKTITNIAISQKSFLTGTMGNYFMYSYAEGCSSLTSLAVPDTSGLESVGNYFMYSYAYGCSSLTSLTVPDTSGLTSVGNHFMRYYAYGCSSLTSLDVPDTSGLESVGSYFMRSYAEGCSKLTSLDVPDTSSLESVGTYFMAYYASVCSSLTSLTVPDTSGLTSVGSYFMRSYAEGCSKLTSLAVPDTSGLESVGNYFMYSYAYGCSSLTKLVLPAVGWFEDHNVDWSVPSGRLGVLEGHVLDSDDLSSWQALTVSGKTLYTNYIRDPELVYYGGTEPAHDIIHTLTFSEASGDCPIRLYRGSTSSISGTVYYRAGTSGDWTSLSVSGTDTTFPVTDTTMQVAHNWNKSGDNYMTPSFRGATNITSIAISQKSSLTGAMGNYFMCFYAYDCSSLTSLAVPDTSGLTSVGTYFMRSYANGCSSLTSLAVPDTSGLTSVGTAFMVSYAEGCSKLTSLAVPDTSGLESVGYMFMYYYANGCSSLTKLVLPAVGWFENHNVSWNVPSGRLGVLEGHVLDSDDLSSWQALTVSGKTLYTNYIRDPELVYYEGYCEYVADLIRTIIQSQSYNADTKRPITQSYTYQADTFRKVNKAYQYSADTERITLKDYAYSADTKRKIIQGHVFTGDTKRGVIKEYAHTADTLRKLLKSYEYQADMLRQVVKSL
jgi:hypothetical protein